MKHQVTCSSQTEALHMQNLLRKNTNGSFKYRKSIITQDNSEFCEMKHLFEQDSR